MADLGNTFDPNEVPEDERSFDPMPAGDYLCQIIDSEVVQTSKGGDMLKLTLEVMDGPYSNRRVWDNLNIRNSNPDAQRIAHRTLADICKAVGLGPITDSEVLHYKPFVATLKIEPERTVGDRTYDARNGVKRYKARSGAAPAARPASQGSQAQRTPPTGGASRPWGNGAGRQPPQAARTPINHDDVPV